MDRSYLNWPFFEEKHKSLYEALIQWAKAHTKQVDHKNCDVEVKRFVAELGKAGFLKHSGLSADNPKIDVRSICLIREVLASFDALADFSFAMQGLGSMAISLFGSDAQKAEYLPKIQSGEHISAFALTEPNSGSDVANISLSAEDCGDHYLLNGEKTWISNGGIADIYTLFARTGEAAGAKGLSAFIVPKDLEGFDVVERLESISPHPLATLSFKNVRLPKENLLGQSGSGFKIAMSALDVMRPSVGAAANGFARRAFDEALNRSETRILFDDKLNQLQMVQAHLAEMALMVDGSALQIYRAAWTKDKGQARITKEAAMAKYTATENAQIVIDKAVQIHGGDGVRVGLICEQLYRDIRALRIYEGASDVQKVIIARDAIANFENSFADFEGN